MANRRQASNVTTYSLRIVTMGIIFNGNSYRNMPECCETLHQWIFLTYVDHLYEYIVHSYHFRYLITDNTI